MLPSLNSDITPFATLYVRDTDVLLLASDVRSRLFVLVESVDSVIVLNRFKAAKDSI